MAIHSIILAWKNPKDRIAWQAAVPRKRVGYHLELNNNNNNNFIDKVEGLKIF